jgi:cystathionine beta-lyase/cystathionine gamma-synthase
MAPPLYQTATFKQPGATENGLYDYTRSGNPTRDLLQANLAELEGGEMGLAFCSGMAAINAAVRLLVAGGHTAGDSNFLVPITPLMRHALIHFMSIIRLHATLRRCSDLFRAKIVRIGNDTETLKVMMQLAK